MIKLTDDELKVLAQDIYKGNVFITNNPEYIDSFMPIMLSTTLPEDIGSIYEYLSEAGPLAVNGRPIFFSCHILTVAETKKVVKYAEKVAEVMAVTQDLLKDILDKEIGDDL